MQRLCLKDLSMLEMQNYIEALGWEKYRGKQLYDWVFAKKIRDFHEIKNMPKKLLAALEAETDLFALQVDQDEVRRSLADGTIKFLSFGRDGYGIETSVMRYNYGNSVCVSSQVGCTIGCAFCASAIGGKKRNLTPGEMVDQIILAENLLTDGTRISNVVIMGTGEPLDNYENLIKFIRMINDTHGMNIGMRNITVSTAGLVPGIEKLAQEKLQLNLAVSLHAAKDALRNRLIPINKVYPIDRLMEACAYYIQNTNRRITFEYVMFDGVNDFPEDALALAELLKSMKAHVNLIPYNPVEEACFARPSNQSVTSFFQVLEKRNINVTIRKERGLDIDGACGQLRIKSMR